MLVTIGDRKELGMKIVVAQPIQTLFRSPDHLLFSYAENLKTWSAQPFLSVAENMGTRNEV
jgi:hypothetical protein